MPEEPPHDPAAGYDVHEHALDSPDQLDLMAEEQPDVMDRHKNQFNNNESGPGAGGRWDPETEIDISVETGPGILTGVGLNAGPSGRITLEELKRRARQKRGGRTIPDEISEEYARARRELENGADPEDIDPIDIRWV